jgi:hypothetical protein
MMKPTVENPTVAGDLHELLTGDDEARLCKDIPESACHHQPRNFLLHVASLGATKTGDGLVDPKLVLAWILGALGAPATVIGLLVPVRESLALLPQLFTAASIRALPQRKYAWAAGSALQGLSVLCMAATALTMEGAAAGFLIVALLAVFALARSVCSVSYKDVLGKTVSKSTRGTATGTAGTIAAAFVFVFAILLSAGVIPKTIASLSIALMVAGGLWLLASVLFLQLAEEQGATEGGRNGFPEALAQLSLMRSDDQLSRFVAVRGLLTATALAPPFILSLGGENSDRNIAELGPFLIASSLASVASTYVWGRLADRSSRIVLITAALAGAVATLTVGMTGLFAPWLASQPMFLALVLFALMIAYQGVRLGRSTHLVDMADREERASYTAVSNTVIGVLLLIGGVFGVMAEFIGVAAVLLVFGIMCAVAALLALGLNEVQE